MSEQAAPGLGTLFQMIVKAIIAGKQVGSPIEHAARVAANTEWAEAAERELAPYVEQLIRPMMSVLPDDHPAKAIFEEMVTPSNQTTFLLNVAGSLGALLGFVRALGPIELQAFVNDLWTIHQDIPLSPFVLADMVERTIKSRDEAANEATMSGINGERFDALVLNTGEPYGPMDAVRLWRQGRIDEAELETVIHYSRIRNQFIPDMKLLAYDKMSPADAVELTLKRVLDHAAGLQAFIEGGGFAEEFDALLEGAGNPIGAETAVALWNHGLIDEAEVDRVIAHGRTNPSFGEDVKLTRHKFLSVFQIHQALTAGAVDPKTAIEWMLADGFNIEQATAFAHAGKVAKATTVKHPSEAMIVELYESKYLDQAQATQALVNMGYIADEVPELLAIYDARRSLALRNKGVSKVQAAFLAKRVTENQARADLTELEVPSAAVDQYLTTWKIERETQIRLLTVGQVGSALKNGYMTVAEATRRFEAMGYAADDVTILVAEHGGPPPPGSPAAIYIAEHPPTTP